MEAMRAFPCEDIEVSDIGRNNDELFGIVKPWGRKEVKAEDIKVHIRRQGTAL